LCGSNPLLSLGVATRFEIANFLRSPRAVPPQALSAHSFLIIQLKDYACERDHYNAVWHLLILSRGPRLCSTVRASVLTFAARIGCAAEAGALARLDLLFLHSRRRL
jgi:hypothetical protein